MIYKKDNVEDVIRRLNFIDNEISDLKKILPVDWNKYKNDRVVQRNVERMAENIANSAIDISKVMLVAEEVEMPNSYKDIILKLGQIGILNDELADKVAEYASLRNVLAHQYLDLKWDKLKPFVQNAPEVFAEFKKRVSDKLKKA